VSDTLTIQMPWLAEDRVLLHGVEWDEYESVLEQVGDRHIFVTYDGRSLEVMSPSPEHDNASEALSRVIHIVSEELDVPIRSLGSTTFREEDLEKGLEPDKCFYTRNEAKIRGKKRLDLRRDPPPDLAIEVEITQRLLDREAIYAALRVPELWRYDGSQLRVFTLVRGKYRQRQRSPTFPDLPLEQVVRWLREGENAEETAWARQVRAWVCRNLAR
jgi:Uma2 family endonuclease